MDPPDRTVPPGGAPFPIKDGEYLGRHRFQSDLAATGRRSFLGKKGERLTHWTFERARGLVGKGAVLDLACGNGRHLAGLLEITPRVFAGDISASMLHAVKMRGGPACPPMGLIRFDAERLPFTDRAFDVVYCARFFHHLPDPGLRARILAEVFRIAARGVVLTYKSKFSYEGVMKPLKAFVLHRPFAWYYIVPREIEHVARRHGWGVTGRKASVPLFGANRALVLEPLDRA